MSKIDIGESLKDLLETVIIAVVIIVMLYKCS